MRGVILGGSRLVATLLFDDGVFLRLSLARRRIELVARETNAHPVAQTRAPATGYQLGRAEGITI